MFGDIHEQNIKQSSLGHKDIVFLRSLHFFFATTDFEIMFFKSGGLAREKHAERITMITNSGYLCIQEILVLTKPSVRLTYRTYIHYPSTPLTDPLTWITEKELEREIKKQRPISLEEKRENSIAALENRRSAIAATKVKMKGSEEKK